MCENQQSCTKHILLHCQPGSLIIGCNIKCNVNVNSLNTPSDNAQNLGVVMENHLLTNILPTWFSYFAKHWNQHQTCTECIIVVGCDYLQTSKISKFNFKSILMTLHIFITDRLKGYRCRSIHMRSRSMFYIRTSKPQRQYGIILIVQ